MCLRLGYGSFARNDWHGRDAHRPRSNQRGTFQGISRALYLLIRMAVNLFLGLIPVGEGLVGWGSLPSGHHVNQALLRVYGRDVSSWGLSSRVFISPQFTAVVNGSLRSRGEHVRPVIAEVFLFQPRRGLRNSRRRGGDTSRTIAHAAQTKHMSLQMKTKVKVLTRVPRNLRRLTFFLRRVIPRKCSLGPLGPSMSAKSCSGAIPRWMRSMVNCLGPLGEQKEREIDAGRQYPYHLLSTSPQPSSGHMPLITLCCLRPSPRRLNLRGSPVRNHRVRFLLAKASERDRILDTLLCNAAIGQRGPRWSTNHSLSPIAISVWDRHCSYHTLRTFQANES